MNEYEKQYAEARFPEPGDLIGTWSVTVLSGYLPNMHKLGHIKVIGYKNSELRGYNRTLGLKWGKFTVGFAKGCAMFCYGNVRFYDKVRLVEPGLLIGKYILICSAGPKMESHFDKEVTGYFQMRRKD